MKRNKFIMTMLAVATVPLFANPQSQKTNTTTNKGFKVKAGEGRIQVPHAWCNQKLTMYSFR